MRTAMSGPRGSTTQKHHFVPGRRLLSSVSALALGISTTMPAFAGSSPPAGAPPAPTPVVTRNPQLSTVGAGGCVQQYDQKLLGLAQQQDTANDVGLAANAVNASAMLTGLIAEEAVSDASTVAFGVIAGGLTAAAAGDPFLAAAPGLGTAAGGATAMTVATGAEAVALAAEIVGATSGVAGVASQIARKCSTSNR